MSDEAKSIKFKFVVDEQSAQRVNRVLDEMIKRAEQLAKTLQGVSGGLLGGGSVGGGGRSPSAQSTLATSGSSTTTQKVSFASILTQNVDMFKKIASEGGTAMKALGDAVGRGTDQQRREIDKLQRSLENLAKTYDRLGGAGGQHADKLQQKILGVSQRIAGHEGQLAKLQSMAPPGAPGAELMPEVPWPDAARPGLFRRMMNRLYSPGAPAGGGSGGGSGALIQGFMPTGLRGIAGVASGIAGAANFALDETLSGSRSYASAEGRRGQLLESKIRQMHAGDTRWLFNLTQIQRDSEARKDLAAQTSGTAAQLEQVRSGAGQLAGSIPVLGAIARTLGLVGPDQGGGALGGFTTTTQQSNMLENSLKQMDEKSKGTAMLYANMAQESFQQRLGTSIALQRTMGLGGLQKDPKGAYRNQAGDLITRLEGEGYDPSQYMSAFTGIRGGSGAHFAGKAAYLAMAANAQGFGGFDQLLNASRRLGQGSKLALGAVGGGIDKAAGIMLGNGVLGQGYDPTGTTSGVGTLAAIQAGMGFTGASSDFNKAAAAIGGLKLGSSITSGSVDGYQQGRNLVGAIRIDPQGSISAQDYLASRSMKQLLDMSRGGKMTQLAKDLDLTPSMFENQLSDSMGSVFDRFTDTTDNPQSRAINAFRDSGMGYGDYLKKLRGEGDLDSIKTLGAASAWLTGGDEEEGVAAARILSGSGERLKNGKVGGKVGGAEKDALESREALQKKVDDVLKVIGDDLRSTIKSLPEATKIVTNMGENLGKEAGEMIEALNSLTAAFSAAAARLGGPGKGPTQVPNGSGQAGIKPPGKKK